MEAMDDLGNDDVELARVTATATVLRGRGAGKMRRAHDVDAQ